MSSGTLNENVQPKWKAKIQLPSSRPTRPPMRNTDRFLEKVEIGPDLLRANDPKNYEKNGKIGKNIGATKPKKNSLNITKKKKKNLLSEYVSEFSKLQAQHLLLEGGQRGKFERQKGEKEMSFNKQMSKIHSAKIINLGGSKGKGGKRKSRKYKGGKSQGEEFEIR